MTCAACQARVQRSLQKRPGVVDAGVNLMTENATVTYRPDLVSPAQLVETIRETGYGAELAPEGRSAFEEQHVHDHARAEEFEELRLRAIVSGVVGAVFMLIGMPGMSACNPAIAMMIVTAGVRISLLRGRDARTGLLHRERAHAGSVSRACRHHHHAHSRRQRHRGTGEAPDVDGVARLGNAATTDGARRSRQRRRRSGKRCPDRAGARRRNDHRASR
jgi:copper chaperone CopZ